MTGRSRRTPARVSAAAYRTAYNVSAATALGHLPLFGSNLAFRREAWLGIRSRVHRNDPEIHDDLDLSFHLGERHSIRYLPGAAMGMSMRPFRDGRALVRRLSRGYRTVFVHWPHDLPPVRVTRRALRRTLGPPAGSRQRQSAS